MGKVVAVKKCWGRKAIGNTAEKPINVFFLTHNGEIFSGKKGNTFCESPLVTLRTLLVPDQRHGILFYHSNSATMISLLTDDDTATSMNNGS